MLSGKALLNWPEKWAKQNNDTAEEVEARNKRKRFSKLKEYFIKVYLRQIDKKISFDTIQNSGSAW